MHYGNLQLALIGVRETGPKSVCCHEGDFQGQGQYEQLANAIEECIFDEFGNTDTKYKNKVRSRIANLKVRQTLLSLDQR